MITRTLGSKGPTVSALGQPLAGRWPPARGRGTAPGPALSA